MDAIRRILCCTAAAACVLLAVTSACRAGVDVEVYRGGRVGVGRITVGLPPDAPSTPSSDDRFAIVEAEGRVMMPVVDNRPVRRILRKFLGIELPAQATFYFLFRGDEPLDLTIYTPWPQRFTVRPESDREEFEELMEDWWEATERHYQHVHREAEYPIVVENFLTATWARRLNQEMPEPGLFLLNQRRLGATWLAQLTANEGYRASIEREIVLGRGVNEVADVPLGMAGVERQPAPSASGGEAGSRPQPPDVEALPQPPNGDIEIEPIAAHVPVECAYLRFGSFINYLWFRDFLNHWQGELGNMVVLRSINHNSGEKLQEQLALRESKLARVMGPTVIRDVAIIGFDAYLRDGPAMGILFHAHNNLLLSTNFNDQRSDALEKHADATDKTVQIAGHDVSFLSSPDGRLRSYYATDGDFHLVSTSRRLVERFFEAGQGSGSLAAAAEFADARAAMPLARDDALFLYLSTPFFENLTSPAYRVELDRRLRSIGEMRTLQLARLAARAEGKSAESIDELIAADLLPPGFGQRPDGSSLVEDKSALRDSVRGLPGWLVPIADLRPESMTATEAARYENFRRLLDDEVGQFVPVVAAKQRLTSDDGELDRIVTDVRFAPYSQTRVAQWANMLAPAAPLRVAPINGDVASLEAVLSVLGQPVHLFGGLRDFQTPLVVRQGEIQPDRSNLEYIRGYFGTWPQPHLFDRLFGPPTGPTDDDGIAPNEGIFSLWQRRVDDFFLFSLKRDVLMEVGPQLAMVEPDRPAQIRASIADLSDKEIATAVSGLGYMRTRQASASGSRFMNSLTTQLQVPPAEAREVAEQLVGGHFECPLGGEYELVDPFSALVNRDAERSAEAGNELPAPPARQLWASTATPPENRFLLTEIPPDYVMPLMTWFRGVNVEVLRDGEADALSLHAELDMVHQEVGPPAEEDNDSDGGFQLPNLGGLFGWGKSEEEKQPEPVPQPKGEPLPPPMEE